MTTLRDTGEFGFIDRVTRHLGSRPDVIVGPGDDCAVVRVGDRTLLITCDLAMEGVHFRRGVVPARDLGWKAAAAALSDIAAMGGVPMFVVSSVAAPADSDADELEAVCAGMIEAAEACGAALVGGDVTRSANGVVLDVTVIGEAPGGRYVLRSGARPGDLFAVTGYPGRAAAGLDAQERGIDAPDLVHVHYHPTPRIREGRWLAGRPAVHAMIDISDGPVQDGGHIAERSGLGLAFTSASVAVDAPITDVCGATGRSIQDYVLFGGEAYELGFAVDPNEAGRLFKAFREEFSLPVVALGQFSDTFSGVLVDGEPPADPGYLHFA
jgi:thiamine-monophosphate kinase